MQATISYGKKPNEAFLLNCGFVDTSYKADFYSADLLEYVVQQEAVPAARVTALAKSPKLHRALESVSNPMVPLLFPDFSPKEILCGTPAAPLLYAWSSQ